jgi:hypothetical protein
MTRISRGPSSCDKNNHREEAEPPLRSPTRWLMRYTDSDPSERPILLLECFLIRRRSRTREAIVVNNGLHNFAEASSFEAFSSLQGEDDHEFDLGYYCSGWVACCKLGHRVIWSGGAVLYLKAKHETEKKYPNLIVIPDSSEINQSSKHATGRGKDSKHATSKNQQVESMG